MLRDMAPTTIAPTPPVHLAFDPCAAPPPPRAGAARPAAGLARARAGHGPGAHGRAAGPGLEALLGGLNPDQLRAVTHGDGTAPRRGRRRDRQDPGHHPPDRLAHRDAPGQAVGDPGADLHGQGRRGDGASGSTSSSRTATRTPRSRRSTPSAIGSSASTRSSSGLPTDLRVLSRAGGRHLPARAPLRVRARPLPAARRPDPLPGGAGDAVQPLQGRGHRRRPTTSRIAATGRRPRPPPWRLRAGTDADRGGSRRTRPPDDRPSSPAPTRRTSGCSPRTGASTSATRSRSPSGSSGRRPPPGARSPGRFRYILVDEFQDTNRAQAELVAAARRGASERDGRR